MIPSSGQALYDRTTLVHCQESINVFGLGVYQQIGCGAHVEVDMWFDNETDECGWTCPKCGMEHCNSITELRERNRE